MTCSADDRVNAQSDAACSPFASMVRGKRRVRDFVAVGPGDRRGVAGRRRQVERRQAGDVGVGLIGRHDHAADSLAEDGAHHRCGARLADGDHAARPVDLVIAAGGGSDRLLQEFQFLREDLFQRAVRREQAVAHEDGLLAALDHLALRAPVVIAGPLLGGGGGDQRDTGG